MSIVTDKSLSFPISGGILLGLGLGGFFDGIVFHQILQWHHLVTSAGYPANTVSNLKLNTLLDGLFHAGTYFFTIAGVLILWNRAPPVRLRWSRKKLLGSVMVGFGIFNLVEGTINHHILGLHHVNETVAQTHWIYWDVGFLIWGAAMLVGGSYLFWSGRTLKMVRE